MTYHIFCNIYRYKLSSVMNSYCLSNKIWCNRRGSRPRFDNSFLSRFNIFCTFLSNFRNTKGPFFNERAILSYLFFSTFYNMFIASLRFRSGFVTFSRYTISRTWMSTRRFSFTTTHWMIYRIHYNRSCSWTTT